MSQDHDYFIYIVTNYTNTVLYIGITNDLGSRLWQHEQGGGGKFTTKYNVSRLLYYEHFREVRDAISREKQLKGWTRAKKEALIRKMNPTFADIGVQLGLQASLSPEGPSTALVPRSAQDDRVDDSTSPAVGERVDSSAPSVTTQRVDGPTSPEIGEPIDAFIPSRTDKSRD